MGAKFLQANAGHSTLPRLVRQSKRKVLFTSHTKVSPNALVEEVAFTVNPSGLRMLLI
jgi:hypothetical protein